MNALEAVVNTPAAQALGWTLVYSLPQGVAVAAVFSAVLLVLRSPRIRYLSGCAALLTISLTFLATLLNFWSAAPAGGMAAFNPAALPPWRALVFAESKGTGNPMLIDVTPWLGPLWFAGVCSLYLRFVADWFYSSRLRRRGVCPAQPLWQEAFGRMAAELKISRPIALLESAFAQTPMVLGHLRPIVLVPLGAFTSLPPNHIEAVLLHELAHIKRADYLVNIFQCLIEALLFYHPAVWWISSVIRAERENCCDDTVVALRGNPQNYAQALASLEQNRSEQPWSTSHTAVAAKGGHLMKRIQRLLYPNSPATTWAPALGLVIMLAAGTLAVAAWPTTNTALSTSQQAASSADGWQKWLNEDVVYIISDEERAAFERQKADDEREQFSAQFWERRDPTPGTEANEFKKEHYRRIAWANQHFRTATGAAGWRTDRGHMYIVYGPPDEIESHPKKEDRDAAEMWMYHRVQGLGSNGLFTFVDRPGTGDFRLAPVTLK